MNAAAASFSEVPPAPGPIPVQEVASCPEFELLLTYCLELSSSELAQRQSMLLGPIDWAKMLRLAEHHHLIPRMYSQLSAVDGVPPKFLETLRTRYRTNARQALWLTSELIRIVAYFESRGIEVLPYKGPTLAETLYADVTMRQFGDLDLLVHAVDVPKAKAALLDLGYTSNIHFTEHEEQAHLASGYEYTFDSSLGRNLVELKWQILPRFYSANFDVDAMFHRASTTNVAEHSLPTLRVEDLLLVLCVHAAKHAWVQLSWICDIDQLAKQPLDWRAIQKQSKELGIERIVAVNFLLTHKLLGSTLPEMVEKSLRTDREIETLAAEILPMISVSAEFNTESIRYFRLMMEVRERWQDRVRFLWRLTCTSTTSEWSTIRLPTQLFPLYRLVRMWRLAGKLFSFRG